jgi:Fic family protein
MNKLSAYLQEEMQAGRKGGLYHKTQVNLAYNSNRIEGSRLTEEQTRFIFETRTIGFKDEDAVPVDDIIETSNHFVAFDYLLDTVNDSLSNELIKKFHGILKTGTSDAQKAWFAIGDRKRLANEVGGVLPAPEIIVGDRYTRIILYAHKTLRQMDQQDKIRACYQHACLKYVSGEYMTNQSLRERFGIEEHNYTMASKIIADTLKMGLIKDCDSENKSRKYAKYLPYWF